MRTNGCKKKINNKRNTWHIYNTFFFCHSGDLVVKVIANYDQWNVNIWLLVIEKLCQLLIAVIVICNKRFDPWFMCYRTSNCDCIQSLLWWALSTQPHHLHCSQPPLWVLSRGTKQFFNCFFLFVPFLFHQPLALVRLFILRFRSGIVLQFTSDIYYFLITDCWQFSFSIKWTVISHFIRALVFFFFFCKTMNTEYDNYW